MSIGVTTWVWNNSRQKGAALLVLLAIADHAHDDGGGAYPSLERIAFKARMAKRNAQRTIRALAEEGELIIHENQGPKGVHVYEIPMVTIPPQERSRPVPQSLVDVLDVGATSEPGVTSTPGGGDIFDTGGGDIHAPT